MHLPFRWNIAKREQLGRLIDGEVDSLAPSYVDALRICCTRVLAFCDNADLVFIGRSPESLFDYLSGILAPTSWGERCSLVNLALRNLVNETTHSRYPAVLRTAYPGALAHGRAVLDFLALAPDRMLARPRPIAFVDLVASGATFHHLWELLVDWASETHLDPAALKRKVRFIGITRQQSTSPNAWRWQQQAHWTRDIPPRAIKNVALASEVWGYLGNTQTKTMVTNPPWRWGDATMSQPGRDAASLHALWRALYLYDVGNTRDQRQRFARALADGPGMRHPWYRGLIQELRRAG
jgi:hypothetical protein